MYVQIVFAVQYRENLIAENWRDEVEKYLCGIVTNKKSKPLAVYCNPDHTHILVGLHPTVAVSDLARDIKANSSSFINDKHWLPRKFNWQEGFGAFTYSRSQLDKVVKYILNQPQHHQKQTFKEEYLETLRQFDIEYDDQYLFEWYE
jgi:REP element-mobilizing transposase RayT